MIESMFVKGESGKDKKELLIIRNREIAVIAAS
jgi:hypothetical protein